MGDGVALRMKRSRLNCSTPIRPVTAPGAVAAFSACAPGVTDCLLPRPPPPSLPRAKCKEPAGSCSDGPVMILLKQALASAHLRSPQSSLQEDTAPPACRGRSAALGAPGVCLSAELVKRRVVRHQRYCALQRRFLYGCICLSHLYPTFLFSLEKPKTANKYG